LPFTTSLAAVHLINSRQVNIAAEGGQAMNMQKKGKHGKDRAKAHTVKALLLVRHSTRSYRGYYFRNVSICILPDLKESFIFGLRSLALSLSLVSQPKMEMGQRVIRIDA
jgi:hypothetical protein